MRTIQSALILAASALALVAPTAEAATTRFRALPLVPEVPAAIGHPNERKALVLDVSALKKRRSDLQAARAAYRRDCENQPVNRPAHRKCQFDLVRLRRDNSRFRTDVNALRERLRRIEAAVIRERQTGRINSLVGARSNSGARIEKIRKALADGDGSWDSVLTLLRKQAALAPGDPVLRDVLGYLVGMGRGYLGARNIGEPYYRHGVRRYLGGDYWSASIAFAKSAREAPDDPAIYATFAHAAGRQHASPACRLTRRCASGDLEKWMGGPGSPNGKSIRRMVTAARSKKMSLEHQRAIRLLQAAAMAESRMPESPAGTGPFKTPKDYIDWWRQAAPDRYRRFLSAYAAGQDSNRLAGVYGKIVSPAGLAEALSRGPDMNPFAGTLTRDQIVRLNR